MRAYNRAVDCSGYDQAKQQQIGIEGSELLAAEVKKLGGQLERSRYPQNRVLFSINLRGTKTADAHLHLLREARGTIALEQ